MNWQVLQGVRCLHPIGEGSSLECYKGSHRKKMDQQFRKTKAENGAHSIPGETVEALTLGEAMPV